jgi:hypothetical protein
MYLVRVSLLLLVSRGLGRPLLPVNWRIVQILHQLRRKTTNANPNTSGEPIQFSSMNNYNPHVISWNDKSNQQWRPTYQLVMLLWRDFMYTEICGGYSSKSSKLFFNNARKVELSYLQSFTCLARVQIKYILHTTSMPISSRNTATIIKPT